MTGCPNCDRRWQKLIAAGGEVVALKAEIAKLRAQMELAVAHPDCHTLHPASEWTEADGPVLWWSAAMETPTVCVRQFHVGGEWCKYYTHWSRIPKVEMPATCLPLRQGEEGA